MDRESFQYVLDLIEDDPVFVSTNPLKPQRPARHQLATFLCRVGSTSAIKTSTVMGIAEGTVFLYVDRVSKALRRRREDHLAWPGEERRQFLSDRGAEYGFPGYIGSGDGCLIRLERRPSAKNPWAYYCRKQFYSVLFL